MCWCWGTNIAVLLDCSRSRLDSVEPVLLTYFTYSLKVIRETPASHGTEASADVLSYLSIFLSIYVNVRLYLHHRSTLTSMRAGCGPGLRRHECRRVWRSGSESGSELEAGRALRGLETVAAASRPSASARSSISRRELTAPGSSAAPRSSPRPMRPHHWRSGSESSGSPDHSASRPEVPWLG